MIKAILALLVTVSACVFAECPCETPKAYVKAEQIIIQENGIYIQMNGFMLQAEALHSDADGLYITVDADKRDCKSPDWWCGFCQQCNAYWYSRCPKCHQWR